MHQFMMTMMALTAFGALMATAKPTTSMKGLCGTPPLRAPWRPRRATASPRAGTRICRTTVTLPISARIRIATFASN
jgi:hypothetical protein